MIEKSRKNNEKRNINKKENEEQQIFETTQKL